MSFISKGLKKITKPFKGLGKKLGKIFDKNKGAIIGALIGGAWGAQIGGLIDHGGGKNPFKPPSRPRAVIGHWYLLELVIGLARAPLGELVEIWADKKQLWAGPCKGGKQQIDALDLFGGERAEGGVRGSLDVRLDTVKGVGLLMFDGEIGNSPHPKPWEIRVRRTPTGEDLHAPALGESLIRLGGEELKAIHAMNPAHIIFECLTNEDWGGGISARRIDIPSFAVAADILRRERFGLCIYWARQQSVEAFIGEICKTVEGVLYQSRLDGLFHFDLLRKPDNKDELLHLTPTTGLLKTLEMQSASPVGAVNELIVSFFDPVLNLNRQVREQDLAGRNAAGAARSETAAFVGVPTLELASLVARREVRVKQAGLRTVKLECDRRAYTLQVGQAFRLSEPRLDIVDTVFRVGRVEDGTLESGEITIRAVEDRFSVADAAVSDDWQPIPEEESGLPPRPAQWLAIDLPYQSLADGFAKQPGLADDEIVLFTVLVLPPRKGLAGVRLEIQKDGKWLYAAEGGFAQYDELGGYLSPTGKQFAGGLLDVDIEVYLGEQIFVGAEIVVVDAIDESTGTATVKRGCVDTIPVPHAAGTQVWGAPDELLFLGDLGEKLGHPYEYGISVVSTAKDEAESDMALAEHTPRARFRHPYPPANVQIGGKYWPELVDCSAAELVVSWAFRCRKAQGAEVVDWFDERDFGPEEGASYTLYIDDAQRGRIVELTGLQVKEVKPDLSMLVLPSPAPGEPCLTSEHSLTLTLFAERAGLESWQRFVHTFNYIAPAPEPEPAPNEP